jgi:uncharacterized protein YceK
MKKLLLFVLVLLLAGCSSLSTEQSPSVLPFDSNASGDISAESLEDLGPAPEWQNETWLNTNQPLYLQDLRGKVVLVDMWTFG